MGGDYYSKAKLFCEKPVCQAANSLKAISAKINSLWSTVTWLRRFLFYFFSFSSVSQQSPHHESLSPAQLTVNLKCVSNFRYSGETVSLTSVIRIFFSMFEDLCPIPVLSPTIASVFPGKTRGLRPLSLSIRLVSWLGDHAGNWLLATGSSSEVPTN